MGLALTVAVCSVVLSTALAWLTLATDLPCRRVASVLVVCPLAVPCYIGAAVYIAAFSSGGLLGWVGGLLGLAPGWFSGFWASAVILTLFTSPLAYLPIRAGLKRVDRAPFEAARLLGRSPLAALRVGVLPQMRSSLVTGGLLVGLYTLGEFGAVSMLRCNTFTRVIWIQYESAFDRTGAALSGLALVGLIGLFLLLGRWLNGSDRSRQGGVGSRPLHWRLGGARLPLFMLLMLLLAAGVLLPVVSLVSWSLRLGADFDPVKNLSGAGLNSLLLSLSAAVVVLLMALPVARLGARHRAPLSGFIERLARVGFGLPGIVVGLSLVFIGLRIVPALYQSWTMMIVGYAVLFLALGAGPVRSGFERVSTSMDEAARTLGATRWSRFRTILLPALRPGLLSAFLLVFISTAKELPCTLLLSPAGTHTLATRVWQYTDEAMYAEAALPALLLILLSGSLVGILIWREDLLERPST